MNPYIAPQKVNRLWVNAVGDLCVEIDGLYEVRAILPVRVRLELGSNCWVVERQVHDEDKDDPETGCPDIDEGEPGACVYWSEVTRFDCGGRP
jgi:hypothetical protein